VKIGVSDSLYSFAKKIPLVRVFTHKVPPYHIGHVIENRLGLQVARVVGRRICWNLRRSQLTADVAEYLNVLERDGILVLSDFLPNEVFSGIREEFESSRPYLTFKKFRNIADGSLEAAAHSVNDRGRFPYVGEYLRDNPLILKIVSAVLRRKVTSPPPARFEVYRKVDSPEADSLVDNDIENILHADLHIPTVKVFYYLSDVNESNGAFVYAKGSHKLTVGRLKHEYDMSVRTAKIRKGHDDIPDALLAVRGPIRRNILSDARKRELNIAETQVCGKANTLIITNNIGFHRRGEFSGTSTRETVVIDFRGLETYFWSDWFKIER
jgi:hypothetical protein